MHTFFFDTSALHSRYHTNQFSKRIRGIVTDTRYSCYIADVSIVEIASSLGKECRSNGWDTDIFDKMDRRFLDDVATKRLKIRTVTKRIMIRARHLIRFAGVKSKRRISASDSLIACCCLELALETQQKVRFYTGDWPLYSILKDIDAFRLALDLRYIGISRPHA